jgi:hypothetical protein
MYKISLKLERDRAAPELSRHIPKVPVFVPSLKEQKPKKNYLVREGIKKLPSTSCCNSAFQKFPMTSFYHVKPQITKEIERPENAMISFFLVRSWQHTVSCSVLEGGRRR